MSKQRLLKYDVIRITALFMIVMIHVSAYMVIFWPETPGAAFHIGNVFNGLGRAGTPLFLMLSGALLLNEDYQIQAKSFYKKSLLRVCLLLLFWLLFYASWRAFLLNAIMGKPLDPELFGKYLLKLEGLYPHLWYMFMLVGAYLAIPVLRLFVKRENRSYVLGIIIVAVVAQFVVQTAGVFTRDMDFTVSDFATKFHLEYATGYIPYLLTGWYLDNFPPTGKKKAALWGLGAVALLVIILLVQFCIDAVPDIRDYIVEMNTLPAYLYGVGLFSLISAVSGNKNCDNAVVQGLSKAAFGIYIIHVVFLDIFTNIVLSYSAFGEHLPGLYLLILYGLTFGCSLVVVCLIAKIKGVRKLFYYD